MTLRLSAPLFRSRGRAASRLKPGDRKQAQSATPHWLRHTHATHALAVGAELTTVRDNLRHASVATTSVYLHTDQVERERQMRNAFPVRRLHRIPRMAHRSLPSVEPDCVELANEAISVLERLYPTDEAMPRVKMRGQKSQGVPA
jgi:hypothetical protein